MPACDPSQCSGCCDALGQCQPGDTIAACGTGGDRCSACAVHRICKADRTCGVDPNSYWHVQPVYAAISPVDDANEPWDLGDPPGSDPDVVAEVWCPGESTPQRSEEVSDTLAPVWTSGGCTARAGDLLAEGLSMRLTDVDVLSDDTILERTSITIIEDELGSAQTWTFQNALVSEIAFEFQPR